MSPKLFRTTAAGLMVSVTLAASAQQTPVPLSPHAQVVKTEVDRLTFGMHISVIPRHLDEEFGTFTSSDATSITFYDVDRRIPVTFSYEDLKKVKKGYSGYNYAVHRHTDRERNLLVVGAVSVALVILIVAAARSK